MNTKLKAFFLIIAWFTIFSGWAISSETEKSSPNRIVLSSHPENGTAYPWQMKRVSEAGGSGEEISSVKYKVDGWEPAIVPGTALNSLVKNGKFPEPYFGQNNLRSNKLIPDIADVGREFYHFWYRTKFRVPSGFEDKKVWIQFDGINYIADIWLNGQKLGMMKGMFVQQKFDITSLVNLKGDNCLAVSIEPVEFPGTMQARSKENVAANENRNGGDGKIGKNVTMLMSAGWDFTFHDGVRDRNTGIWRDVSVYSTGTVSLENPFIKSSLPIPMLSPAREEISMELINNSNEAQQVKLSGEIKEASINLVKTVFLSPGEKKKVEFKPEEFKELIIENPKLWWPINKGPQNRYTLNMKAEVNGKISDEITKRFGVRDIRSDQNTPGQVRIFYVNGKRLFIRGSNWIPEAMLRTSNERTYAELRYTQQAGVNMLRLWGGGISESDYFFDLCDEMGFLVWHEFWMTGDTNPPADTSLYFGNVRSTINRIRNHPSLAYYVSSNEQDNILDIKPILNQLDGTRGYQFQSECCGVHDGSPYKYENPMQYYDNSASPRGSRIDGFCPEYGTACLPTVEALREMMPEKDLWPINKATWDYLDGNGFHLMTTKYNTAVEQYGKSDNIEDYIWKGQMVGAIAYRGIWENWNYNKFEFGDRFATGVLFWYHNSPVRQVCSRMWDWSLEPTAALYYAQDALEPLHAQYDFIKNTVSIYNEYYQSFSKLKVRFRLIDINMKTLQEEEKTFDIGEDAVKNDLLKIQLPESDLTSVHFIKLELFDESGKLISDTFYWRSMSKYVGPWTVGGPLHGGFESLNQLPKVELASSVSEYKKDGRKYFKVELKNPSKSLAFFIRVKLMNKHDHTLIRPAFYSDNYFSLLPGESKLVTVEAAGTKATKGKWELLLEGFNVRKNSLNLAGAH